MTDQNLDLLDAIKIAKEAEQKAATLYGDAAKKAKHPLGRSVFEELAKFEQYHYDKLTDLENSLRDQGAFIEYAGRELAMPARGEVEEIEEADRMTAMEVVTMAQDIEVKAEKRYADLAEQTADPDGRAMFSRLAEEEHGHHRILRNAYWNLTNRGVLAWSKE